MSAWSPLSVPFPEAAKLFCVREEAVVLGAGRCRRRLMAFGESADNRHALGRAGSGKLPEEIDGLRRERRHRNGVRSVGDRSTARDRVSIDRAGRDVLAYVA